MSEVTEFKSSSALAMSEDELIKILQTSIYPGAAVPSIKMVIGYCKAGNLDPMQKPVHIVPMWDSKAGVMRDVIMPGVNLYRTQAARSGQFAGMSEPEFGKEIRKNLGGVDIEYPEFCKVTVKRLLPNGSIAEFTAVEYWMENYAVKGGKEKSIAPNAMWQKRPRGQIAKCASAQALRIAFPEIASQNTAEEMEGKPLMNDIEPEQSAKNAQKEPPKELLKAATLASKNGTEPYEKFFAGIKKEERILLKKYHESLWAEALEADSKKVIDVPPSEIKEAPIATQSTDDFVAGLDAGEYVPE